jgi:hypothetical protein
MYIYIFLSIIVLCAIGTFCFLMSYTLSETLSILSTASFLLFVQLSACIDKAKSCFDKEMSELINSFSSLKQKHNLELSPEAKGIITIYLLEHCIKGNDGFDFPENIEGLPEEARTEVYDLIRRYSLWFIVSCEKNKISEAKRLSHLQNGNATFEGHSYLDFMTTLDPAAL